MNIQAMMKQAQKLQKDMMDAKEQINFMEFTSKSSVVEVKAMGNKKITSIKISLEEAEKEDIEMIEDMVTVAVNDVLNQIEKTTNDKLGKYTQGMPGLF